jgi:transcriptional regulator with XRE-family HTH domain
MTSASIEPGPAARLLNGSGGADTPGDGPAIRRHRLGSQLRQLREARALRLEDVAAQLGVAPSTLSRIENGSAPTRTSYLKLMLDLYQVSDPVQRGLLADLASEGQRQDLWACHRDVLPPGAAAYLGIEAAATSMRGYYDHAVPGLLQTASYAAAAIKALWPRLSEEQAARLVMLTTRRQCILGDGQHRLHLVIDEATLLRSLAPPDVMAAQLDHLRALTASPALTIQVAALARTRPLLSPPFTLLSFGAAGDPDVACRLGPAGRITRTTKTVDIRELRQTFATLAANALPPAESATLISQLADRVRAGNARPAPC